MGAPSTPRVPVYVYHAANDDVVPYADVPGMVDSWCNDGATVEFVTDVAPSTNHFAMEILHFPAVLDWLKGRFDGTINPSGCSRKEISQSLLGSTTLAESVGGSSAAAAVNAANAALQASPLE
jgi:ribosomal protein S11